MSISLYYSTEPYSYDIGRDWYELHPKNKTILENRCEVKSFDLYRIVQIASD